MSNIGQGFKPKATVARIAPGAILCKCQICNCGSHRCSGEDHKYLLTPYEKDALRSSYQQQYPAHPLNHVPRRDENRPKQDAIFGNSKFDGMTTCQSDFRPPQGGRAAPVKPRSGDPGIISGGNNARDFTSENRASFAPKGYAVRESYAPMTSHTTKLPFEGASTNSMDYRPHQGAKPSTPFREQPTVGHLKEDRDFQTEAALKFVQHGNQRRQGFAPQSRNRDNMPFEGQSTTATDFRAHYGAKPSTPFREQPTVGHLKEDRDFKSSSAMEYQPKGYQVRESFKPSSDRSAANLPFDAQSTAKTDYTGAPGTKAQSARPRGGLTDTIGVPIGAKDDRQWLSENRGAFEPKGYQARQSYAPSASHTTKLPFEGASTSSTDYRAHQGAKPSTPFREQPTVGHLKEDRDFQSEAHLKYQPHGVHVRESFSPNHRTGRVDLPFEGESTTKSDYKPWVREGCPANEIPDFPNHHNDKEGHKLLTLKEGQWQPYIARR